jgi:hypothetical protein
MFRNRKIVAGFAAAGLLAATGTGVAVAASPGHADHGSGASTQAAPVKGGHVTPKPGQPDTIALTRAADGSITVAALGTPQAASADSAPVSGANPVAPKPGQPDTIAVQQAAPSSPNSAPTQ